MNWIRKIASIYIPLSDRQQTTDNRQQTTDNRRQRSRNRPLWGHDRRQRFDRWSRV